MVSEFGEWDHVFRHVTEVRFRILILRGTQTFVVLGGPSRNMGVILCPLLVLWNGKEVFERLPLLNLLDARYYELFCQPFTYPDDRSDKLHQKLGESEQGRVKVVEEVDQQALDMRTIVILQTASVTSTHPRLRAYLIRHDHEPPVTQAFK